MAGNDVYLYSVPTDANSNDVRLRDPTTSGAAGGSYTLTAQAGSYAITGISATLTRSKSLTASAGSYAITGVSATVSRNRTLTASAGSYALTGQTGTLLRSKALTASAGSYTLSGQSSTLLHSRLISASAGSYAVNGVSATLTYTPGAAAYTLIAQPGSYALSGVSASLLRSKLVTAQSGSYALTGKSATLTYTPVGAYTLTALPGSYSLTGFSASLAYSGQSAPAPEVFSGGFAVSFERALASRDKRRRDAEKALEEASQLKDAVDAEIASLIHEDLAKEAEAADLARIRRLVESYAKRNDVDSQRVQAAIDRAAEDLTYSRLQALEREFARMQEEEEMALLMVLAHFD